MDKIISHKDLIVWQKAITLACRVYAATANMPREERFGLQAQMRRAVVSVPSNIAEGSARRSRLEFMQFLHIARASLAEVETQYLIAIHQGLLSDAGALDQIADVGRLLNGLIRSLVSSDRRAHARACAPPTANR